MPGLGPREGLEAVGGIIAALEAAVDGNDNVTRIAVQDVDAQRRGREARGDGLQVLLGVQGSVGVAVLNRGWQQGLGLRIETVECSRPPFVQASPEVTKVDQLRGLVVVDANIANHRAASAGGHGVRRRRRGAAWSAAARWSRAGEVHGDPSLWSTAAAKGRKYNSAQAADADWILHDATDVGTEDVHGGIELVVGHAPTAARLRPGHHRAVALQVAHQEVDEVVGVAGACRARDGRVNDGVHHRLPRKAQHLHLVRLNCRLPTTKDIQICRRHLRRRRR